MGDGGSLRSRPCLLRCLQSNAAHRALIQILLALLPASTLLATAQSDRSQSSSFALSPASEFSVADTRQPSQLSSINNSAQNNNANISISVDEPKRIVTIVLSPPPIKPGRTIKINKTNSISSNNADSLFLAAANSLKATLGDALNFNSGNTMTSASSGLIVDDLFVDFQQLCEMGAPFMANGILAFCSNREQSSCPKDFWCHVGSTKVTTYCCPVGRLHSCQQELNVGSGNGQMARFYYDKTTRRCLQFRYRGYGGNENNYFTQTDCESTCGGSTFSSSAAASKLLNTRSERGPDGVQVQPQSPVYHSQAHSPPRQLPQPPGIQLAPPGMQGYSTQTQQQQQYYQYYPPAIQGGQQLPYAVAAAQPTTYPQPAYTYTNSSRYVNTPPQSSNTMGSLPQQANANFNSQAYQAYAQPNPYASNLNNVNPYAFQLPPAQFQIPQQWNQPPQQLQPQPAPQYQHMSPPQPMLPQQQQQQPGVKAYQQLYNVMGYTSTPMPPFPLHVCLYDSAVYGTGSLKIKRFYYDVAAGKCFEFQWSGAGGNPNNFATLPECEIRCKVGRQESQNRPSEIGPPQPLPSQQTNVGSGIFHHQPPPSPDNAISILSAKPGATHQANYHNPCIYPFSQGQGFSPSSRWFYSQEATQCLPFTYLGAGGNLNNFVSLIDCQDACGTSIRGDARICVLPQLPGKGNFSIPRWSFDSKTDKCALFIYSGSGGNHNRFASELICLQSCRQTEASRAAAVANSNQAAIQQQQQIQQQQPQQPYSASVQSQYTGYYMPMPAVYHAQQPTGSQQVAGQPANYHPGAATAYAQQQHMPYPQVGFPQLMTGYPQTGYAQVGYQQQPNSFQSSAYAQQQPFQYPAGIGYPAYQMGQHQQPYVSTNLRPDQQRVAAAVQQANGQMVYHGQPQGTQPWPNDKNGQQPASSNNFQDLWSENGRFPPPIPESLSDQVQSSFVNELSQVAQMQPLRSSLTKQYDLESPCLLGEPAPYPGTSNPIFCSTATMHICPIGYYCHIGSSSLTTVCCKLQSVNACTLPLATGRGTSVMARWHFDFSTSQCKAFTYTGSKGNENNFLTLVDCRKTCPEFDNPCTMGTPPFNQITGQVMFCSVANPNCPTDSWCHIGATRQTSVCCPYSDENPCAQTKEVGTGNSQLPRFYYDQSLRICDQFTYSGKTGNQNNFMTKAECESACPVLDNPCADGMPAITATGSPLLCSTTNTDICPETYFCHIGFNAASTVCCPGASDPCRMPLSKGNGAAVLSRWYFNTDTKTCLSFSYSGRGGNQNNFVSLAECKAKCPEFENPCSAGQPHIGLNGQITRCGATTPTICPVTFWCHIGATLETSVCCPGADNACDMPMLTGNGKANLLRYYYDRAMLVCRPFQYSGMNGNENNFLGQVDCEKRCPVFKNPCATGEPARNDQGQLVPCSVSSMDSCPRGYWCHIAADEQATLCCPGATNPCHEPLQIGTGGSALPRHYYNPLTKQCLAFTYSGSGGTQNNFLSRADCERNCPVFANPCSAGEPATGPNGEYILCTSTNINACPANYWCHISDMSSNSVCCPGADNPCILPAATGHGAASLTRWFFDANVRRCTQFTYSGMGGNQNNFLVLSDCQMRCPEFQNPCSTGDPAQSEHGGIVFCSTEASNCPHSYWCHVGSDSESTVCCPGANDPCLQSMAPGSGSSKLPRFYFNQNTRTCLSFTYTGKGGNQNNFLGESECASRCPVFQNPCQVPIKPPVVYCSAQNREVCAAGYYCHVGGTSDTSVCCPGAGNPCAMPVAGGKVGQSLQPHSTLSRWYFDVTDRRCKQFGYYGTSGNQNNFLTQIECQQKCPEFTNPCSSGEPYREPMNGIVRFCNHHLPNDCPNGFFCHIGSNTDSTVCCPGQHADPCSLPISTGSGPASMPRWFFNQARRQCQQFTYTGIGGNQNNFQTQRECQSLCPEFTNPCGSGTPLTSISGQISYCTAQNPMVCPPNYFCHLGASQESSVCCPVAGDPCSQSKAVGTGSSSLQRWSFNSLMRRCELFFYSGSGGNQNNFLTLESCQSRCHEFKNPCYGQPYMTMGNQVLYCNSGTSCPTNYFCHIGDDVSTTMCCPSQGDPCSLNVAMGSGTAQLMRYYYNSQAGICSPFVYSGLGGNENNFASDMECQARCRAQPSTRTGTAMFPSSYSNYHNMYGASPYAAYSRQRLAPSTATNRSVLSNGTDLRGLRPQSGTNPCTPGEEPFLDKNGKVIPCGLISGNSIAAICPMGYYCHVGAVAENTVCCPLGEIPRCELNVAEGIGDSLVYRWYFNQMSQLCQPFVYRGSRGNANNFLTESDCFSTCSPDFASEAPMSLAFNADLGAVSAVAVACPHGQPAKKDGSLLECRMDSRNCPPDYVCNVHSDTQKSACCPDPKVFCLQQVVDGPPSCGAEKSIRYGYDPQSDSCIFFLYHGCQGNLNNFYNQEQCTRVCVNKGFNKLLRLQTRKNDFKSFAFALDEFVLEFSDRNGTFSNSEKLPFDLSESQANASTFLSPAARSGKTRPMTTDADFGKEGSSISQKQETVGNATTAPKSLEHNDTFGDSSKESDVSSSSMQPTTTVTQVFSGNEVVLDVDTSTSFAAETSTAAWTKQTPSSLSPIFEESQERSGKQRPHKKSESDNNTILSWFKNLLS